MSLRYDLVIFDCDGTLVDSLDGIVRSANLALAEAGGGPHLSMASIAAVVGLSLHEAMGVLMPEASEACRDQAVAAYKSHYQRLADGGELTTPLFPGVRATLDQLRRHGVTLAVATGKSLRGLERTLREQRLEGIFAVLMTADQAPSKPHPSMIEQILAATGHAPERCLMVGDTVYDLDMGRNAGVRTAAVTFGCHGREELAGSRPDHWLERMPDLLPVVGVAALDPSGELG
ncbi:MAG: HAD-IA family hydrolase [Magnetococcales bacterium]|nr:HAD-IA family hydrolase [Magnetococcales bacterium]